jgi:hypothetical protein
MIGFDMPSALLCPARFCAPNVVGGVVILPSMSYLVLHHHHQKRRETTVKDFGEVWKALNPPQHRLFTIISLPLLHRPDAAEEFITLRRAGLPQP